MARFIHPLQQNGTYPYPQPNFTNQLYCQVTSAPLSPVFYGQTPQMQLIPILTNFSPNPALNMPISYLSPPQQHFQFPNIVLNHLPVSSQRNQGYFTSLHTSTARSEFNRFGSSSPNGLLQVASDILNSATGVTSKEGFTSSKELNHGSSRCSSTSLSQSVSTEVTYLSDDDQSVISCPICGKPYDLSEHASVTLSCLHKSCHKCYSDSVNGAEIVTENMIRTVVCNLCTRIIDPKLQHLDGTLPCEKKLHLIVFMEKISDLRNQLMHYENADIQCSDCGKMERVDACYISNIKQFEQARDMNGNPVITSVFCMMCVTSHHNVQNFTNLCFYISSIRPNKTLELERMAVKVERMSWNLSCSFAKVTAKLDDMAKELRDMKDIAYFGKTSGIRDTVIKRAERLESTAETLAIDLDQILTFNCNPIDREFETIKEQNRNDTQKHCYLSEVDRAIPEST